VIHKCMLVITTEVKKLINKKFKPIWETGYEPDEAYRRKKCNGLVSSVLWSRRHRSRVSSKQIHRCIAHTHRLYLVCFNRYVCISLA
jgi:hypothetical protein